MKKIAEALVECGYADSYDYQPYDNDGYCDGEDRIWLDCTEDELGELVEPFADTIEGRRQADALEDWLFNDEIMLVLKWVQIRYPQLRFEGANAFTKRTDKIKWCFEQLEEGE